MTTSILNKSELARQCGVQYQTINKWMKLGYTPEECIKKAQALNNPQPKAKTGESKIEAETRNQIAIANKNELEVKRLRGELVSKDEVNAWVAGCLLRFRDIMLRIAPELKDKLAMEPDPVAIEQLITAEVVRALREIQEFKQ